MPKVSATGISRHLRKRAGQSRRSIIHDDLHTTKNVVSLARFRRMKRGAKKRTDVAGLDTRGGASLIHDRRAFRIKYRARKSQAAKPVNRLGKAPYLSRRRKH